MAEKESPTILHGQPIIHLSLRKRQFGMSESAPLFIEEVQQSGLYY